MRVNEEQRLAPRLRSREGQAGSLERTAQRAGPDGQAAQARDAAGHAAGLLAPLVAQGRVGASQVAPRAVAGRQRMAEEVQTRQQQQQAAMQANSKQTLLQQKQQGDMQLEDKKIAGRIATNAVKQTHQTAVESPLDRASSFAERTADERTMQTTPFFAGSAPGGS